MAPLDIGCSGVLSAMSAMVNFEIPWINILSKMDLVDPKSDEGTGGRNGPRLKKDVARCVCYTVLCRSSLNPFAKIP